MTEDREKELLREARLQGEGGTMTILGGEVEELLLKVSPPLIPNALQFWGRSSVVVDYVVEEVSRQGHDVLAVDGIIRVGWMLNAWVVGIALWNLGFVPTIETIEQLGRLVEPEKNRNGFRTVGVRVGTRICPPAERVVPQLTALCESLRGTESGLSLLSPLEVYKAFELTHPFVDGNGRTGKILLNWLNGTLLNPIFPPSDLFGEPIRNP